MPISDKSILAPEPPNPRVPLRRSTFIVLVVLVMSVALGLSLLVPGSGPAARGAASADAGSQPVHFGKHQAIDDEIASAQGRLRAPGQGNGEGADSPPSLAAGMPPGPPGLLSQARHENSVASLAHRPPPAGILQPLAGPPAASSAAASDPAAEAVVRLEHEARVRMAKALAHDFSEMAVTHRPAPDDSGAAGTQSPMAWALPQPTPAVLPLRSTARGAARSTALTEAPAEPAAAASEALQPQFDSLRRSAESLAAPASSSARGPATWLRDYADSAAGQRPAALHARDPVHPRVLLQGKVIPAVLTRDLVSDLPGRLSAMVSAPVYDSLGRGELLVPMGSLLVGSYDSAVAEGQTRLMMAFERLVLPDGRSFDLPAAPGSDLAGAAGATGSVNHHFLRKFSSALFIAVLADRVRQPAQVTQVGGTGLTTAAGQVLVDVSRGVLEQNRGIKPTLTIPAGTRVHVEVTSDMTFARAFPPATPP